MIGYNTEGVRLWTIQDAKDGDMIYVSTEEKGIQAIFYKYEGGIIYFHCNLCGDFIADGYMPIGAIEFVSPLQKVHYQRFFQKMHEAGYEWSEEKLELKKIEQKPAKWHRQDEQNLNACLGYIPDEFLRRWLTDIIHVKYDKSVELPKGEDYGIDGLYAAVDILKKTLGKVDGYQTDDGILEHKCAISAVKNLYEQKSSWSEEDEKFFKTALWHISNSISNGTNTDIHCDTMEWLKSLKERYAWKPSDEQIKAVKLARSFVVDDLYEHPALSEILIELEKQLKKL